jgi:hypothetical protein
VTGRQAECPGARVGAIDARTAEQARTVAGIDTQIAQIDASVDKPTERGSARTALAVADQQRKSRDRAQSADGLVELRTERAKLEGERARVEASAGPVRYLATMTEMDTEEAVAGIGIATASGARPNDGASPRLTRRPARWSSTPRSMANGVRWGGVGSRGATSTQWRARFRLETARRDCQVIAKPSGRSGNST